MGSIPSASTKLFENGDKMKVIQESQREVYDFAIEEIKEISCPMCLAKVEYVEREVEQKAEYTFDFKPYIKRHISCPCCKSEIILYERGGI